MAQKIVLKNVFKHDYLPIVNYDTSMCTWFDMIQQFL